MRGHRLADPELRCPLFYYSVVPEEARPVVGKEASRRPPRCLKSLSTTLIDPSFRRFLVKSLLVDPQFDVSFCSYRDKNCGGNIAQRIEDFPTRNVSRNAFDSFVVETMRVLLTSPLCSVIHRYDRHSLFLYVGIALLCMCTFQWELYGIEEKYRARDILLILMASVPVPFFFSFSSPLTEGIS